MKKVKIKSGSQENFDGYQNGDKCPMCGKYLMVNKIGSRWCSGTECNFHEPSWEKTAERIAS